MILSNITVPLLGMVDTAVVGHLDSPHYIGAVAVGATIFSFIYTGLNFLRMGTTGITAQALGADDNSELRTVLGQVLGIALAMAALLLVFQLPIGALALWLIAPSPEVTAQTELYYSIRIWSAPAALANFALVGWFIGLHNSRAPLLMMILVNLVNIGLDILLVVYLGYKTDGVAIASVLAEYSGLMVGLLLVARELRLRPGQWLRERLIDRTRIKRLFAVNANLLIRTMSLMFAFGFLTAMGARQGDIILAANAILLNMQYFMASALDGFANAAEAMVGRAIGAQHRDSIRKAIRLSMFWSVLIAVVFMAAWAAGGRPIIYLLTDIEAVRATALLYLPWVIISPIVSTWSFLYDGVYVGATLAREMRNTMLASTFLVFVPAFYLLQPLGNHGLWLAFLLFMAARGLTMHFLLPRKLAALT
ncbi:MAG: MATE family efflux transporter [Gammaproteobacteria bacterium]|nr:MATE family efflux transporter [Gammaproteobacteria bacterium]NNF61669.1 MATE family efflux transporter [Gammaproteobacteria bacterium]NNM21235.1 MATE family efflux transporter [Gammaproteobacteria bacterium]